MIHDGVVMGAKRELDALGIRKLAAPDKVVMVTDHDVIYGSPAWNAGIAPGSTLVAVNGRKFDPDIFMDALKAGKAETAKLELLVSNSDFYQVHDINYHGGERYAHLVRDESKPDLLDEIIKPLAK